MPGDSISAVELSISEVNDGGGVSLGDLTYKILTNEFSKICAEFG